MMLNCLCLEKVTHHGFGLSDAWLHCYGGKIVHNSNSSLRHIEIGLDQKRSSHVKSFLVRIGRLLM